MNTLGMPRIDWSLVNQLAAPYGPERMIYGVRGAGGTNIGGESHG